MLKNTIINRKATIQIAKALGELNQEVVFMGGAMVSLYIDDKAAEDIRPTKDIDLTFQVTTVGKLEGLRVKLNQKGFMETSDEKIMCRFKYENLMVDVMSTREVGWAPSNPWFKPGFEKSVVVNLDGQEIKILPLPYFLASKMGAFFDRGVQDLYASHDLEDIVYIFNYTSDLAEQVLAADPDVAQYLKDSVQKIVENDKIMAAIPGHLYFDSVDERMEIIIKTMNQIREGI
jgi:predicted nucleotidyltransferase